MKAAAFLAAASAAVTAFKRALQAAELAAPAAANDDSDVGQLLARFRALQAKAASGTAGAVAARREMAAVRNELLRRGVH